MAINHFLILFILKFIICGTIVQAQTFIGIPNWRYIPSDQNLGKQLEDLDSKNYKKAEKDLIKKALDQRVFEKGNVEEGEARMILAKVCLKNNMPFCAYSLGLTTLRDFPGSMPALWALETIEKIVMEQNFTEKNLKKIINSASFKEVSEALLPMVNFYVALDNAERALLPWVRAAAKKIGTENFWSLRWKYLLSLEIAKRSKPEQAAQRLESLLEESKNYKKINDLIKLQLARIKFELLDYTESLKLYSQIKAHGRLAGRILRERAWVYYAKGEYAETLGLLQSIKAPRYQLSDDPDQFLLEMLTYRKLCHFNATKIPAQTFLSRYGAAIEQVRQRRSVTENLKLMQLSFIKDSFSIEVETVGQIIEEKNKLVLLSWPESFKNELQKIYEQTSKEIREDVEIKLQKDWPDEALRLLQVADQIQLVDYLSNLDAFRIEKGFDKKKYESTLAPFNDFGLLYWPVRSDEYWLDELSNYKVLIKDQCAGAVAQVGKIK